MSKNASLANLAVKAGGATGMPPGSAITRANSKTRSDSDGRLVNLLQLLVEGVKDPKKAQAATEAFELVKESTIEAERVREKVRRKMNALEAEVEDLKAALSVQVGNTKDMEKAFKDDLVAEVKEREAVEKQIGKVNKELGEVRNAAGSGGGRGERDLRKHEIRAEKREREANVVIRGVPYPGHQETQQQAYEAVLALLNSMDLSEPPRIRFVRRLVNRTKTPPAGAKPPPMLVSFDGLDQKKLIFGALPVWGREEANKGYRFASDVPPLLKKEYDGLEKRAFDLRKAVRGVKTRVIFQDVTCVLMVKQPGETRFHPDKAAGPDAPTSSAPAQAQAAATSS